MFSLKALQLIYIQTFPGNLITIRLKLDHFIIAYYFSSVLKWSGLRERMSKFTLKSFIGSALRHFCYEPPAHKYVACIIKLLRSLMTIVNDDHK